MYLAYIDESGDDGKKKGASRTYSLGCVMVESNQWADTFDQLISFRRHVRDQFKVPVRAELKANFLLRNGGPLRATPLSAGARHRLYRSHMRLQAKLGLLSFAVVIDKEKAAGKFAGARPASDIAWEYLLQRLERHASTNKTEILIVHDEGDASTVRARARKVRRAGSAGSQLGTGRRSVPFRGLLDDPVPRDSSQSYFLQLADLNAYAAFRAVHPAALVPGRTPVVPSSMWSELGSALHTPVRNTARWGGVPAIVPGP